MVKLVVVAFAFLPALPGQQPAESDGSLGQRLWQAAAPRSYQAGLQEVAAGHSLTRIVDALTEHGQPLAGHLGKRIVWTLLDTDRMEDLWQQEPDRRRARAAVFAQSRIRWVRRWVQAGGAERADIEHLAQFMEASDQSVGRALHDRDDAVAKAARKLRRLAVRAELAKPQPDLARIVATPPGTADDAPGIYPTAIAYDVFALARFVEDERPHVRAAALVLLRERLRREVPRSVREALRQHPNVHLRWNQAPVPPAVLDGRGHTFRIAKVDAGGDPDQLLPPSYVAGQSSKARGEIAMALMRAALRVQPAEQVSTSEWQMGLAVPRVAIVSPEEQRATALLTRAAGASEEVAQLIVALARPGRDVRLRMRALLAVVWSPSPNSADLVEDLLDDPDPRIAMGAAQIAAVLLAPSAPATSKLASLREAIGDRARALLQSGAAIEARHRLRAAGCGTLEGAVPLVAVDADSLTVWTAARLGDARLLDPLIARAAAAGAAGPARTLVMACLARLAPLAGAAQAERAWQLLSRALPASEERAILTGMVGALSEQRRKVLLQFAVDGFAQQVCAGMAAAGERVPVAIAEAFVARLGIENRAVRPLLWRCPSLLRSAWQEGGASRQSVLRAMQRAVVDWSLWQEAFGDWPDDMVVDVVRWANDLPTPPLELVARLARVRVDERMLVRWLQARPEGEVARDLPYLSVLTKHSNWQVAHAAAWRAHALGEPGQELFRGTMARLLATKDLIVVQNLLFSMVRNEVAAPGWRAAANRLQKHPGRAAVADQATAMFGGVSIESVAASSRASVLGDSDTASSLPSSSGSLAITTSLQCCAVVRRRPSRPRFGSWRSARRGRRACTKWWWRSWIRTTPLCVVLPTGRWLAVTARCSRTPGWSTKPGSIQMRRFARWWGQCSA